MITEFVKFIQTYSDISILLLLLLSVWDQWDLKKKVKYLEKDIEYIKLEIRNERYF